jgi:hypothetical protein
MDEHGDLTPCIEDPHGRTSDEIDRIAKSSGQGLFLALRVEPAERKNRLRAHGDAEIGHSPRGTRRQLLVGGGFQ